MARTLAEKIVTSVGTGDEVPELEALVTATASGAELNYLDITTLGTGAASKAVVLDAGEDYTMPATGVWTAGVEKDVAGTTLAATYAELNARNAAASRFVVIADATPYTVLAANSGKWHIISEQTSSITINLPVHSVGLEYEFIMGGVANEAQNWVFVATTPSFWNGGVVWLDQDNAADNVEPVYGNGTSHLTFTVVTPMAGTVIRAFATTGGEWLLSGSVNSPSTPTMA